jgi:peroxiredoxin Q/BCP
MRFCTLLALAAAFGICLPALAADVNVGDAAPSFSSTDDQGKPWKSTDYVGKKILVVYFYPADMTSGCTRQACGFRDDMKKLQDQGVEVVGVSGDAVRNHQIFKKVHNLNFTLLADEDGSVAKAFGVPLGPAGEVKQVIDGKEEVLKRGCTARRWTFVIDKQGKIASKDTEVKAAEDSKKILDVVQKLQ